MQQYLIVRNLVCLCSYVHTNSAYYFLLTVSFCKKNIKLSTIKKNVVKIYGEIMLTDVFSN